MLGNTNRPPPQEICYHLLLFLDWYLVRHLDRIWGRNSQYIYIFGEVDLGGCS